MDYRAADAPMQGKKVVQGAAEPRTQSAVSNR